LGRWKVLKIRLELKGEPTLGGQLKSAKKMFLKRQKKLRKNK